jgi:hypothetical protein
VESQLTVSLEPFSLDLVKRTFMEIEEPEDALDFPVRRTLESAPAETTIGQFYGAIRDAIVALGDSIFATPHSPQVTRVLAPDDVPAITDVASAVAAIGTIVEEGEGTAQSPLDGLAGEIAHYYRFAEIFFGGVLTAVADPPPDAKPDDRYFYDKAANPIPFDPSGVHPLPVDPKFFDAGTKAERLRATFDYDYTSLLKVLHATFNSEPDAIDRAIGLMDSLREQALELVTVPAGHGMNAAPTFRYQPTNP